MSARGVATELQGADPAAASLIETVRRFDVPYPPEPEAVNAVVALIARVGRATFEITTQAVRLINYLGLTVVVMLQARGQGRDASAAPRWSVIWSSRASTPCPSSG